MSRYTQALEARSERWRPSIVSIDEKRRGAIIWLRVNGMVVFICAKTVFIVHYFLLLGGPCEPPIVALTSAGSVVSFWKW